MDSAQIVVEGSVGAPPVRHAIEQLRTTLASDDEFRALAEECRNIGVWPVLVGEEGERHTMLASPIIIYDHPKIAPESPGDLYDATEIDQLLRLSVLSLSDEERQEIRAGDPRGREILDLCEGLSPDQLMLLHGALRDVRGVTT